MHKCCTLEMYNICKKQWCFPEEPSILCFWFSREALHLADGNHRRWSITLAVSNSHWDQTWLLCQWCSHSKHDYCGSLLLQETPTWPAGSNTMNERVIWADSLVPIPISTAEVHAMLWSCQVVVGTQKGTRALLKNSLKLIQAHMQWSKALFQAQKQINSLLSPAFLWL